ncbi:hypothetical protein ACJRO7_030510 [Eucalyptus globulus]|uniref:Uncharacterized protein n=1 Tax=Eucalyptus globulus TaxID=34317 RepID=A0ABD3JFD7_EUCGL
MTSGSGCNTFRPSPSSFPNKNKPGEEVVSDVATTNEAQFFVTTDERGKEGVSFPAHQVGLRNGEIQLLVQLVQLVQPVQKTILDLTSRVSDSCPFLACRGVAVSLGQVDEGCTRFLKPITRNVVSPCPDEQKTPAEKHTDYRNPIVEKLSTPSNLA